MKRFLFFLSLMIITNTVISQEYWHGKLRELRYQPEGEDIVITNGNRRFNRALYGGNTAFRAEAGDLPEFALYLPGMGGNIKLGLVRGGNSKWLVNAKYIKAIYRSGSMLYEISDPLLTTGTLFLHLIPSYEREALYIKIYGKSLPDDLSLVSVYGGVYGKKFSRDGDIGADPESSFDLKPEYCTGNIINVLEKEISVHSANGNRVVHFSADTDISFTVGSANAQDSPMMMLSARADSTFPVVVARRKMNDDGIILSFDADGNVKSKLSLSVLFDKAEKDRQKISNKVIVSTPDPYINSLAGPLSIAADAIWDSPSYMHGAVAWRMRLNGWRGAYIGDVLGWHDRARTHFNAYLAVQVKEPVEGPVEMDTSLHLARHREVLGTSLFSAGYISREPNSKLRAHHYDMNLVFFDQIFNHLDWTGDTTYARKIWDQIALHLQWEKRNFDSDDDGLYDAYAAIWASDALQYSGGGVTHSTAYNYSANLKMVELGKLLGKDVTAFKKEADKIYQAVTKWLWLSKKGWFAEYKDALGNKLVHDQPGIWTIYHAIDEGLADPFKAWQSLRFIDHNIPHIPIRVNSLRDSSLYTISTTSWQPYTWSLNNVAYSELMHTALAYWQGHRNEEAFRLFRSSLIESMFLGAGAGNFHQLSFYDAIRGELYRDFADGIGMTGRSLIEGLFGIRPNLLKNEILIKPGFPKKWDSAFIQTDDLSFRYLRRMDNELFQITQKLGTKVTVRLQIPVRKTGLKHVMVNGVSVNWLPVKEAIATPLIEIVIPNGDKHKVELIWEGEAIEQVDQVDSITVGKTFQWTTTSSILKVYDPQQAFHEIVTTKNSFKGKGQQEGPVTIFVQIKKGNFSWWSPVHLMVDAIKKDVFVYERKPGSHLNPVDISAYFNAEVAQIFKDRYASPRLKIPTLQLPLQGIGNWAYPNVQPEISDIGLRKKVDEKGLIRLANDLIFYTPKFDKKNIMYVSMWDNYPDSIIIPLTERASFLHLLMTGSTNPMQSRLNNGLIEVEYADGEKDSLFLRNPENWWPIEQDYYMDDYAFNTNSPKPLRLSLQSGEIIQKGFKYSGIKGFSSYGIEGGAATVLGMPLTKEKELKALKLKALANDVVIGLMSITLER